VKERGRIIALCAHSLIYFLLPKVTVEWLELPTRIPKVLDLNFGSETL
jgi:hypothetical protein